MVTGDYHFITVKDQGPVIFQYLFHVKELLHGEPRLEIEIFCLYV